MTRRHRRTRTVKTDRGISQEFEKFFDQLVGPTEVRLDAPGELSGGFLVCPSPKNLLRVLRHRAQVDFHATVLRAASFRVVVGDRLVGAHARSREALLRDAVLRELIHDDRKSIV